MTAVSGSVQVRGRKAGGGAVSGYPALKSREFFLDQIYNGGTGMIWLGFGDDGNGNATSVVGLPVAAVDLGSAQTLTGVKTFSASPVVPTPAAGDASTKAASTAFVMSALLSAIYNRDSKESVRAASQTNVTLSGPGANIGGVAMNNGDRFAALAQTTNTEPGIYIFNGASAAATRAPDAVQGEVTSGEFFFVEEGTYAGMGFELTTANPITLGTTALTYGEFDAKGAAQTSYSGVDGGYA